MISNVSPLRVKPSRRAPTILSSAGPSRRTAIPAPQFSVSYKQTDAGNSGGTNAKHFFGIRRRDAANGQNGNLDARGDFSKRLEPDRFLARCIKNRPEHDEI